MKRSYESPAPSTLVGAALCHTAKTLKVDNIRQKQTPLMRLALSSNKPSTSQNDSELTDSTGGRQPDQDTFSGSRFSRNPNSSSLQNTSGSLITQQYVENIRNLSSFFMVPGDKSTLFLIEERKTNTFRKESDTRNAWVKKDSKPMFPEGFRCGEISMIKRLGCLTFVLENRKLTIINGPTGELEIINGIEAFEVLGNRYLIAFSVSCFTINLYEYSEDSHKLSQVIRPISTAGKSFYSFAMSPNKRIFLADTKNRVYELTNNYTQLKCVCSPLRQSLFSTVTSFLYSAVTLSLSFDDNNTRAHNMTLFCDNSRNILYAFDKMTGYVTAYKATGKAGELPQIASGNCALLDGEGFSGVNKSIVFVAPVEATVSQVVNLVVVYGCGIMDFFSVDMYGIEIRYRRSVADLLRATTANHSMTLPLSSQGMLSSLTMSVRERTIFNDKVAVKEVFYKDGSFIFVIASDSNVITLHSTSIDLILGKESVCYFINTVVGDEALGSNPNRRNMKHFIIGQDKAQYLRTPPAYFDIDSDISTEVDGILDIITHSKQEDDFTEQLFKDPSTFSILPNRRATNNIETYRNYPINKLESLLCTRSHTLASFLEMFSHNEVFAMSIALYCRAGFKRHSGSGFAGPVPATDESSVDKTLADASKRLYTTFMGDSGAMVRLEGTALFVARMLQRILPCRVCESKPGRYGKNFINCWSHDEALSSYTYASRAYELISSVSDRCFPLSTGNLVASIRKLLASTTSTLGLILTLTEVDLQKVVKRLSLEEQTNLTSFRVFQLADNRALVFAILSSLIDVSLESFNKMCGILLERCPLFFTDTELARFRGMHALIRMKASLGAEKPLPQREIESLAEKSLAEFSKVPFLNVNHICKVYANFGLYDFIVKLGLGRAQNCELRQETVEILLSPSAKNADIQELISDPEELKRIYYKKSCYKVVLDFFSFLKTGVFPDVERRKIKKLSTKVTADETRRLVTLAQEFKDEMWHFELYQWFLTNNLEQDLLDITNTAEYVIKYLNSCGNTNLLWKYYIRQGRNKEGISCLYSKATSTRERIPIQQRMEYFSIILNLLRTNSDQDMRLSNVYSNFELLKLQHEIVTISEGSDILNPSERSELNERIFSFAELKDFISKKENYNFYVFLIELIRLEQNVTTTLRDVRNVYNNKILSKYDLPALIACAKRFYVEFPGDDATADLYFPVNFVMEVLTKKFAVNSEEFLSELLGLKGQKRSLWEPIWGFYTRKFRTAGSNESAEEWLKGIAFIGKKYVAEYQKSEKLTVAILDFVSEVINKKGGIGIETDKEIMDSLGEVRNALI